MALDGAGMTKPTVVTLSAGSLQSLEKVIQKAVRQELERNSKKVSRKKRLTEPATESDNEEGE